MQRQLLLASASPRRRELLALLGVAFDVRPPLREEGTPLRGEPVEEAVRRLALEKAKGVARGAAGSLVLGADTLVVLDGEPLGKPASQAGAEAMLQRLRGRQHQVVTGVALVEGPLGKAWSASIESTVTMRSYSQPEVARYVRSGDPLDKAGAYAVQDPTFAPAARVEGCYLNVVGLPLCIVAPAVRQAGLPLSVKEEDLTTWCPGCALLTGERDG